MYIIKIRYVKFKDLYGENGIGLFSLYVNLIQVFNNNIFKYSVYQLNRIRNFFEMLYQSQFFFLLCFYVYFVRYNCIF